MGLALALVAGGSPAAAQFTSGVDIVEVYATVLDAAGKPVTGLSAEDFTVTEDGVSQSVDVFAAEQVPLAVAVAVDRSFSIPRDRLKAMTAAAAAFVGALGQDDEVAVLAIGSDVELYARLGTGHDAAVRALEMLEPWGTTPLYDAALEAIDLTHAAAGRRALLLLSDGADRYSETTSAALVEHARRRNVIVYPVAVGPSRPAVFAELAAVTGGRSAHVKDVRQLGPVLEAIALELGSQYLLGYSPDRVRDDVSRWRAIGVTVARPDALVRARDGYFAP